MIEFFVQTIYSLCHVYTCLRPGKNRQVNIKSHYPECELLGQLVDLSFVARVPVIALHFRRLIKHTF